MANNTPLSNTETASFCSQMAMILKSGISALEGISIMLEDSKTPEEKEILSSVYEKLTQTGSLYEALKETAVYPSYMLSMIQLGEQTGRMDEVMSSLSDYYEKEADLNQTIKNAVAYPLIMILMMIAVILVLITKVMPVFNQVFRQLGTEMTGISKGILTLGAFLNAHGMILLVILLLLVFSAIYLTKSKRGQALTLRMIGHFRGTRFLADEIAAYRFANGMALTLSSGLTPEECLKLTADLIPEGPFQKKLEKCKQLVADGEDLCDSLLSCDIFTGVYTRMASIASRTGVMDEVMQKIAGQYEDEIDARISGILSAIEPTLVIILSVIVGIILLSVMLPLMSILSAL